MPAAGRLASARLAGRGAVEAGPERRWRRVQVLAFFLVELLVPFGFLATRSYCFTRGDLHEIRRCTHPAFQPESNFTRLNGGL